MKQTSTICTVLFAALVVFAPGELLAQGAGTTSTSSVLEHIVIRPGDLLRVSVWPDRELGGEFVVEQNGSVHLPLLGEVRAGGVTLSELRATLRKGYGETMKNPVVTVTPEFHVGVLGAVRAPGVYRATPSHTLLEVIGLAGGFAGKAARGRIRIVREEGVVRYNAARALETGRGVRALRLQSGDQIVVPTSGGITFGGVIGFIQTGATIGFLIDRLISN